ncbi:interferon-induced protein with tetratricopeptide repeats 2-like [Panthera pardus]|uniref:Interferon-induced protein with tetratricopeptide repeats 2-like n=1 Tax=Panthera pardus TaxID=9691 RepID=A0A9W2W5J8_PANPR|nr:interferon-induced protein with tetratricopeptide repeats 2-like [Panthera pardus]
MFITQLEIVVRKKVNNGKSLVSSFSGLSTGNEVNRNSLEKILPQLKCHFTWNLLKKDGVSRDLEDRVCNQIEFVNAEFKATMYNFLAYIKHLNGHNEAALECLQQAEELVQREHSDRAEIRRLVTWGNSAWVYYHLGRLTDAQIYVDKVKQVCGKLPNQYSTEWPLGSSVTKAARVLCRAGHWELWMPPQCVDTGGSRSSLFPAICVGPSFPGSGWGRTKAGPLPGATKGFRNPVFTWLFLSQLEPFVAGSCLLALGRASWHGQDQGQKEAVLLLFLKLFSGFLFHCC